MKALDFINENFDEVNELCSYCGLEMQENRFDYVFILDESKLKLYIDKEENINSIQELANKLNEMIYWIYEEQIQPVIICLDRVERKQINLI